LSQQLALVAHLGHEDDAKAEEQSVHQPSYRILGAIDAGAVGYLLKDAEPDELLRGVRAAAAGEAPFSPKAAKALLTLGAQRQVATDLSDRERQVLGCVVEGLPNKLIARRLAISEKTVKAHLTRSSAASG